MKISGVHINGRFILSGLMPLGLGVLFLMAMVIMIIEAAGPSMTDQLVLGSLLLYVTAIILLGHLFTFKQVSETAWRKPQKHTSFWNLFAEWFGQSAVWHSIGFVFAPMVLMIMAALLATLLGHGAIDLQQVEPLAGIALLGAGTLAGFLVIAVYGTMMIIPILICFTLPVTLLSCLGFRFPKTPQ